MAADLARISADWIWLGAALSGYCTAKVGRRAGGMYSHRRLKWVGALC